jgi:hypothetical protein
MNTMQNNQTIEPRSLLRDFHQILSNKRSLARSAFNNLKPGQKRLLLIASGIELRTSAIYANYNITWQTQYDNLTDNEIDNLKRGLRRLQSIIDAFALCEEQDFKKETKKEA